MTKEETIRKVSREELLAGNSRARRKQLTSLLDDPDVYFAVVLESPDKRIRKIVTVGPTLDFESIEAVVSHGFEGIVPVSYVDCRSIHRAQDAGGKGRFLRFRRRVDEDASAGASQVAVELAPDESSASALLRRKLELDAEAAALQEREAELNRMEEALLERMNDHMQKGAELEQWEENLFQRERKLAEQAAPRKGARA